LPEEDADGLMLFVYFLEGATSKFNFEMNSQQNKKSQQDNFQNKYLIKCNLHATEPQN